MIEGTFGKVSDTEVEMYFVKVFECQIKFWI